MRSPIAIMIPLAIVGSVLSLGSIIFIGTKMRVYIEFLYIRSVHSPDGLKSKVMSVEMHAPESYIFNFQTNKNKSC
jgi:hypothetical protein